MLRPRISTRWLMVAVATIALILGYFERRKVQQRGDEYRGRGRGFANRANLEAERERYLRDLAHRLAAQARKIAEQATEDLALAEQAGPSSPSEIDPGILGGPLLPRPSAHLAREKYQLGIDTAFTQARQAQQLLDESRRVAGRARHFAGLRAKYERAADEAWLPVAPDPPEP